MNKNTRRLKAAQRKDAKFQPRKSTKPKVGASAPAMTKAFGPRRDT